MARVSFTASAEIITLMFPKSCGSLKEGSWRVTRIDQMGVRELTVVMVSDVFK